MSSNENRRLRVVTIPQCNGFSYSYIGRSPITAVPKETAVPTERKHRSRSVYLASWPAFERVRCPVLTGKPAITTANSSNPFCLPPATEQRHDDASPSVYATVVALVLSTRRAGRRDSLGPVGRRDAESRRRIFAEKIAVKFLPKTFHRIRQHPCRRSAGRAVPAAVPTLSGRLRCRRCRRPATSTAAGVASAAALTVRSADGALKRPIAANKRRM